MRKIFSPWASSGNKRSLADRTSDGTVSYDTGYGPQYEGSVDSTGKVTSALRPIDREGLNGLLFDVTDNLREWQLKGFPEWVQPAGSADDPGYFRAAIVRYNGTLYQSLSDGNTSLPTNVSAWDVYLSSQELLYRIPYLYSGVSAGSVDFNSAAIAGSRQELDFKSDSDVQSSQNGPTSFMTTAPSTFTPAAAGFVRNMVDSGSTTQLFVDANGAIRPRGYLQSTGQWSGWRALADSSQTIDLWNQPIPENNTADWNTFMSRGIYNVYGFQGPNHPPVDQVNNQWGTLQVLWPKNWFGLVVQIVTKFESSTTVIYSRVRRPDTGVWSGWTGGDMSNKLDRRGDTINGDLIIAGTGLDPAASSELAFLPPGATKGPFIRANPAGNTQMVDVNYTTVNLDISDGDRRVYFNNKRPSWLGYTPWDNGNFDPNQKVSAIAGRSQQGYIEGLTTDQLLMFWNEVNMVSTTVNNTATGGIWTTLLFDPASLAPNGVGCQWQSARQQYGPIGGVGSGWEVSSPQWVTGMGSNNGNSTANNMYVNARIIQNQGG
ncbi:hypothetical protein [Burkholderia phage BCSR129]|nr:hypothetical protein [Burkholderia phage BCSR129]